MSNRIAVFNQGSIEQVGTPREIYDHPTTAFVAGFVGTSNVMSAAMSQELMGVSAVHSVRPERIRIVQESIADSEVSVSGTVNDVQYLGAESRVRVALADGSHLLAIVPSDGLVGAAIGGPIRLAWSRYAAFTVAPTNITSEGGDQ